MSGKSIKEKNLFNGFDEKNLMIALEKCESKIHELIDDNITEMA